MVDAEEEGEGFPEQRLRFSSSFWRSGWLGWPFECLTAQRVSEWVAWWLDGEWTTQRCTLGDCKISHFRELDVYWDTSTLPHTSTHIHTHRLTHMSGHLLLKFKNVYICMYSFVCTQPVNNIREFEGSSLAYVCIYICICIFGFGSAKVWNLVYK